MGDMVDNIINTGKKRILAKAGPFIREVEAELDAAEADAKPFLSSVTNDQALKALRLLFPEQPIENLNGLISAYLHLIKVESILEKKWDEEKGSV
jgi:hypothetical protein